MARRRMERRTANVFLIDNLVLPVVLPKCLIVLVSKRFNRIGFQPKRFAIILKCHFGHFLFCLIKDVLLHLRRFTVNLINFLIVFGD